jgi:DNA repair protein RAD50
MRKDIEEAIQKENAKNEEAGNLEASYFELKSANLVFYAEATGFQSIFEKYENLKKHKTILEQNREDQLEGMTVMSGMSARPGFGIS